MAHIWFRADQENWQIATLKERRLVLTDKKDVPVRGQNSADDRGLALVAPAGVGDDGDELWAIMPSGTEHVSVNGSPAAMRTGLQLLHDRDELRIADGRRLYFSTESLAAVVAFPGSKHRTLCPRCKQQIAEGDLAVQCPGTGCGRWYHQTEELPCWTYAENCAHCPQKTSLESSYNWTPEEL